VFFAYLSGTGVPEPFRQHSVFIGLGTNVGDRCAYLTAALAALGSLVTIHQCSSVYETEPLGYGSQPWFLNMVVKATTLHQPQQLLQELKALEQRMGRTPTFRNGPRCIDLDLLLFDDLVLRDHDLTLPHPRIHERKFVLVPMCEIAPDVLHPVFGMTMRQLLASLSSTAQVTVWASTLPQH